VSDTAIADYGLISDCHSGALVSREGSIDWLCLPRFDAPSVFGRLLDDDAGHFSIRPRVRSETTRRYVEESMVLETTFETVEGSLVVLRNSRVQEADIELILDRRVTFRPAIWTKRPSDSLFGRVTAVSKSWTETVRRQVMDSLEKTPSEPSAPAVPEEPEDGITTGSLFPVIRATDPKADAALKFARAVVDTREGVGDQDIEAIRAAGYDDEQIAEIVAHVALNVLTNYFNKTAQVEIDFPPVEPTRVAA
jgi:hypothetical protein